MCMQTTVEIILLTVHRIVLLTVIVAGIQWTSDIRNTLPARMN